MEHIEISKVWIIDNGNMACIIPWKTCRGRLIDCFRYGSQFECFYVETIVEVWIQLKLIAIFMKYRRLASVLASVVIAPIIIDNEAGPDSAGGAAFLPAQE